MSLFSSIGSALRLGAGALVSQIPIVGPSLGGAIASSAVKRTTGKIPGFGFLAGGPTAMAAPPALPGAGFAPQPLSLTQFPPGGIPTRQASFLDPGVPGPGIFSPTQPPPGYHLSKRPPYRFVKNRKMNYANGRAAMRAARRVKGTIKLLRKLEKSLPKQKTTRRSYGPRHITGPQHTR